MTALSIPREPEDITADWLTDALRSSGVITTSSATSIDAGDTSAGHGFTGRIARLAVTYDSHEKEAPRSIIAKFPSYDPAIRAAVTDSAMSYEREIRCYENLLGNVALSTPRRYYSAHDAESGECILLLQDLAPARFGDNVGTPSREDIDSAIRAIAGFHAEFWESPRLADMDWAPRICAGRGRAPASLPAGHRPVPLDVGRVPAAGDDRHYQPLRWEPGAHQAATQPSPSHCPPRRLPPRQSGV